MLQQDVLLADGLEQVVSAGQRPRQPRAEWRELQLRVIFQAGDREQPGQVDRTVDLVQLRFCQAELAQQKSVSGFGQLSATSRRTASP